MISIAIDGYAGSGKSTIARALAQKLGFRILDTGALYRAIACQFVAFGLDEKKISEKYIEDFAKKIDITVKFLPCKGELQQHVFVNGTDHTKNLRTEKISALSSKISPFQCVRDKVLFLQRDFAKKNNVCMEGRDIGSVVLPDANFKFFCVADENVRVQRRFDQQVATGAKVKFEDVLAELRARDYADVHRDHGALVKTKESIVIDTTNQTVEESVEFCLKKMRDKGWLPNKK